MERKVKALVLTGYGLNCDWETAYALDKVGATARRVHVNSLLWGEERLHDYHIFVFDGGFSFGDDHGAGVILAMKIKHHLGEAFDHFLKDGKLVIGICNGFQVLVNMGLLPGFSENPRERKVALTWNDCGNFRDQWVNLSVNENSPCVFTRGIKNLQLPVRHGEGKFYAPHDVLAKLVRRNHVAMRYATDDFKPARGKFPYNPNGSLEDIAGICDSTGRVFGLMPHPEAFNQWANHPEWTRLKQATENNDLLLSDEPPGLKIFRNAVQYCKENLI